MAKILIADHDRDYRELVIFTLRFAGYVMVGASSGNECIALVRENQPDLILMELDLPDVSFVVTYKELKSNDATASIPIILLIKHDEVESFRADPQAWEGSFLLKSLTPDQLTKRVNQFYRSLQKARS